MTDLFSFHRRATSTTVIGKLCLGSDHPIRIQSMTTTDTNDTNACVEQAQRIIRAGGELVRLTTQGKREAENLRNISAALRQKGYDTPLVADVHFNANVATTSIRGELSSNWNIPTRNMPRKSRKSRLALCPSCVSAARRARLFASE